jgi:hypothetical protein
MVLANVKIYNYLCVLILSGIKITIIIVKGNYDNWYPWEDEKYWNFLRSIIKKYSEKLKRLFCARTNERNF